MKFDKPPLLYSEKIELLKCRGMLIPDAAIAERYLRYINYYRLSAYWLPFELPPVPPETRSHLFKPGTTFDQVIKSYHFDRKLRLLVMEAVGRIEVSLRARWSYEVAIANGSHAYLDAGLFRDSEQHKNDLTNLRDEIARSKETFIEHYRDKYSDPELPPIWAVVEVMSLGTLSRWFKNYGDDRIKKAIAKEFQIPAVSVFQSILHHLTTVRNHCAHHARLWNRRMVVKCQQPYSLASRMVPEDPSRHRERLLFNTLVVLDTLVAAIEPGNTWSQRLLELISTITEPELANMGFPADWRARSPWCELVLTALTKA